MALLIPDLPRCSPFELAAAVRRAIEEGPSVESATASLEGRLPTRDELEAAGAKVAAGEPPDDARALALLEAPYLVAASDGLEAQERQALSALIARLVGSAPPESICAVLDWFDQRLGEQGLPARLREVGKHFQERAEREQVLSFATLLALADRRLATAEQKVLLSLGTELGFKQAEVQMVVHKMALRLERAMAMSIPAPPPPPSAPDGKPESDKPVVPPTERSS